MFTSRLPWLCVGLGVVLVAIAPYQLTDEYLLILAVCGCFALSAIGLTLLTGYAGQISLGHAFFVAVGGYVGALLGDDAALPFPLWLAGAGLAGALAGLVVGPIAQRLRGNGLAFVTLALLFFANYAFTNWEWLTGGAVGRQVKVSLLPAGLTDALGFSAPEQGTFWVVWALVGLGALVTKNLTRTRPGRAMQAVRDRDVAAECCGVEVGRYTVAAFAVSSALAAMGGALYLDVVLHTIVASEVGGIAGLSLSITFVAVVIVGGISRVWGVVPGALLVVGLPLWLGPNVASVPLLREVVGDSKFLTFNAFSEVLLGLLIVLFLLVEPDGLAALFARITRRRPVVVPPAHPSEAS